MTASGFAPTIADGVPNPKNTNTMLRLAIIFGIIALVAAILGFGGIAGAFASIAVTLFYVFLAIFVILLIVGIVTGRKVTGR